MKTYIVVLPDCTSFKKHRAFFVKGAPNPGPQDRVPETRAPDILVFHRHVISRLKNQVVYHRQKCHQFHGEEKWRTLRKRAAIGRRNMHHHSYTSGSKEVPACIRNSVLAR